MPWSAYAGEYSRLKQSKTGVRVIIMVGAPLKLALDAAAKVKKGPIIPRTDLSRRSNVGSDNQPFDELASAREILSMKVRRMPNDGRASAQYLEVTLDCSAKGSLRHRKTRNPRPHREIRRSVPHH